MHLDFQDRKEREVSPTLEVQAFQEQREKEEKQVQQTAQRKIRELD